MKSKQTLNKGSDSKSSHHYIMIIIKMTNINVECKKLCINPSLFRISGPSTLNIPCTTDTIPVHVLTCIRPRGHTLTLCFFGMSQPFLRDRHNE